MKLPQIGHLVSVFYLVSLPYPSDAPHAKLLLNMFNRVILLAEVGEARVLN